MIFTKFNIFFRVLFFTFVLLLLTLILFILALQLIVVITTFLYFFNLLNNIDPEVAIFITLILKQLL